MLTSLSLLLLTPACLILVFLLRFLLPSSLLLRVTAFALFPCFLSFLDYISASVLPSFPLPLLSSILPFSSLPPPCSVYWSFLNSSSLFFFSFPFISSSCNSPIPLFFLAFLSPFFLQVSSSPLFFLASLSPFFFLQFSYSSSLLSYLPSSLSSFLVPLFFLAFLSPFFSLQVSSSPISFLS